MLDKVSLPEASTLTQEEISDYFYRLTEGDDASPILNIISLYSSVGGSSVGARLDREVCKRAGHFGPSSLATFGCIKALHQVWLTHGDLIDGSPSRHDNPAIWAESGDATVIAAGDHPFSDAKASHFEARVLEPGQCLAAVHRAVSGKNHGQSADLAAGFSLAAQEYGAEHAPGRAANEAAGIPDGIGTPTASLCLCDLPETKVLLMPFEVSANHIQPLAAPLTARAIVSGGCFGSMAAALRQRANDYGVTLHDRCDRPDGWATVFEHEGFRRDAGRTVICAHWLIEELFALFGLKLSHRVTLAAPDYEVEASAQQLARRHPEAARVLACELPVGSGRYLGRLAQVHTARL